MKDFDILKNLCSRLDISIERVLNQTNTIFQDKQLISLDLSHMKIIYLPDSIFSKLQYLEDLDLSNNKIRIINDKVFENCCTISRLLIQENKSLILLKDTFQCMKDLFDLNITLNNVNSLAMLSECNFPSLTILSLNSNKSLPVNLFHKMKRLRNLSIVCPRKLDGNLFKNLNLRFLRLSKMSSIAEGLLDPLNNLEEIHLNENKFNLLPIKLFFNLQSLKLLNLSDNQIKSLDEEMFRYLNNLEELDLSNNKMSILKDGLFDNLYNLKILNLSGNTVDSIYFKNTNIYY